MLSCRRRVCLCVLNSVYVWMSQIFGTIFFSLSQKNIYTYTNIICYTIRYNQHWKPDFDGCFRSYDSVIFNCTICMNWICKSYTHSWVNFVSLFTLYISFKFPSIKKYKYNHSNVPKWYTVLNCWIVELLFIWITHINVSDSEKQRNLGIFLLIRMEYL